MSYYPKQYKRYVEDYDTDFDMDDMEDFFQDWPEKYHDEFDRLSEKAEYDRCERFESEMEAYEEKWAKRLSES